MLMERVARKGYPLFCFCVRFVLHESVEYQELFCVFPKLAGIAIAER